MCMAIHLHLIESLESDQDVVFLYTVASWRSAALSEEIENKNVTFTQSGCVQGYFRQSIV